MAIVVLLAAGTGTRFNHSRPKQLEELAQLEKALNRILY